MIRLFQ